MTEEENNIQNIMKSQYLGFENVILNLPLFECHLTTSNLIKYALSK